ncbi:MAG: ATP-binding cassette domain-containing protein [Candidatus Promineifilaceae bacterium]|nr:ATP-binding cassette domain-containing protein [Candidatus Promineifilaceae bacterium]
MPVSNDAADAVPPTENCYNVPIMIALRDLQKVVAQRTVLEIASLQVEPGEIAAAIIGPSDSGIEVLLALLSGQARPTSGSVRIAGASPATERLLFSQRTGVLFGEDSLYTTRSPRANLAFRARLRGLSDERVDQVLDVVGLADHGRAKYDQLSSGRRLRAWVA